MSTRSVAGSKSALVFLSFVYLACTSANISNTSAIDEAKAVVQSHEGFARSGNLDAIMSNAAEDIVVLAAPLIKGKAAFRDVYAGYLVSPTTSAPCYFTAWRGGISFHRMASQSLSQTISFWC
ncbi:MAG: hypothetical protein ACXW2Q_04130 [Thermoanaerobaculia bacterium]